MTDRLPKLHLAGWRAAKDRLHLYCQMVARSDLGAIQG